MKNIDANIFSRPCIKKQNFTENSLNISFLLAKNFLKYRIAADLLDSKDFNLLFHSKMYLPYQMNNVHELSLKNEQNLNINEKCLVLNKYIHPHKSLDLPKTSTTDLCLTNPDEQKLMGMLALVLEGLAPVLVLVLVKQGQALELAVKLLVSSLVLMYQYMKSKTKN